MTDRSEEPTAPPHLADLIRPGPSFSAVVAAMVSNWIWILLFIAAAAGGGFVAGGLFEPSYEASATLSASDAPSELGMLGTRVPGAAVTKDHVRMLALSQELKQRTAADLGRGAEHLPVLDVAVSAERDSSFVFLTVRAADPQTAIATVNAFAENTVVLRGEELRTHLHGVLEALDNALRTAEVEFRAAIAAEERAPDDLTLQVRRSAAERLVRELLERRLELAIEVDTASGGVSIVQPAVTADQVPGPSPTSLAILGGLAALMLSGFITHAVLSHGAHREPRDRDRHRSAPLNGSSATP